MFYLLLMPRMVPMQIVLNAPIFFFHNLFLSFPIFDPSITSINIEVFHSFFLETSPSVSQV